MNGIRVHIAKNDRLQIAQFIKLMKGMKSP
jgi:hypothetical protein